MRKEYKWVYFDKNPYSNAGYYSVGHTELAFNSLCKYIPANWDECFSYNWADIMMFGLKPSDYFKYVQWKYHALVKESNGLIKGIQFANAQDAEQYALELERRFQLCADEGYFGEYYDAD